MFKQAARDQLQPVQVAIPPRPMDAQLRLHNGAMTLFIHAKPYPFVAYKPTELDDDVLFAETVHKTVPDMARRGVHLQFVPIYFDWTAPHTYDFQRVDFRVRQILQADPQAYIFLRVQAKALCPDWWIDANPTQIVRFAGRRQDNGLPRIPHQTGAFPSLASDFWDQAGIPALQALAAHVKQQDYVSRVVGYVPTSYNSNEWFLRSYDVRQVSDLCPAMRQAFRAHLQRLAGRALDKEVPDRYERGEADHGYLLDPDPQRAKFPTVEYYRFVNTLCAQTILKVTRALREAHAPQRIVIGTFYGYSHGLANFCWLPDSGHLALERLLQDDGPDFICSPLDYFTRNSREEPAGAFRWAQGTAPDSTRLAGKAYFGEDDIVPIDYGEPRGCWSSAGDWEEDAALIRNNFNFTLCKGQLQWWYDLHGHWWEAPSRLDTVEQCAAIAKDALKRNRAPVAEVAVVVDEQASWYMTLDPVLQRAMFWESFFHSFGQIGAPVDLVMLSDLPRADLSRYKTVFFPSLTAVDTQQRQWIDALKCDGRTLVFYQVGGMIDPDAGKAIDIDHVCRLTGMQIGQSRTMFQMRLTTGADHPLLHGCENVSFGLHIEKLVNPYVRDLDAVPLGYFNGRGPVGMAVKSFAQWRSIYCAVPGMPYGIVRNIIRHAGVHLYNDAPDILYANQSYIGIFAKQRDGERTIRLPAPRRVIERYSGRVVADTPVSEFTFNMKALRSYLFELD